MLRVWLKNPSPNKKWKVIDNTGHGFFIQIIINDKYLLIMYKISENKNLKYVLKMILNYLKVFKFEKNKKRNILIKSHWDSVSVK